MFDPIFGAILWTIVLLPILPIVVRLIKWRHLRYSLIGILLLQVLIGLAIMLIQPYALESTKDNSGHIVAMPQLVVNPLVRWLMLGSILTGWSLIFSRKSDHEVAGIDSTNAASIALLIAIAFYFLSLKSLDFMDRETREEIYKQLGAYG